MPQIIGIDVGTKTLGLAVSDEGATVALPLKTLDRRGMRKDLAALTELIEERGVGEIVVGLPLNLDGTPGAMSEEADAVAAAIEKACDVVVHRWDERMSTVAAERVLLEADVSRKRRRKVIDKLAATLILQGWLDRRQLAQAEGEPAPGNDA